MALLDAFASVEQAVGAALTGFGTLNSPSNPSGIVRSPRPYVSVNGTPLPVESVISVEVTNASHFTADTYRVELAVKGLPAAFNGDFWSSSANTQIAVGISVNGEMPQTLILGQVDDIDHDWCKRSITLTGRDLSAALIDNKTAEKFQNKKSFEIAQTLALRRGLDSNVTATTTLAGTYYNIDHTVLTQEQTEWDLLVYLAQNEGFDVWVSGNTLYFQPPPVTTSPPYLLLWSEPGDGTVASNAVALKLQRSETLAKDIDVAVRSWNQKQQKAFTVHAKRTGAYKNQRVGGKGQLYTFNRPNLTRDAAQKLADSILYDLTLHEKVITASLPGDNLLTTRAMVRLAGTGTDWDQLYYPDTVHRSISNEGYGMELRAKNHATESTVAI